MDFDAPNGASFFCLSLGLDILRYNTAAFVCLHLIGNAERRESPSLTLYIP